MSENLCCSSESNLNFSMRNQKLEGGEFIRNEERNKPQADSFPATSQHI
jgi:hypothetical protein